MTQFLLDFMMTAGTLAVFIALGVVLNWWVFHDE